MTDLRVVPVDGAAMLEQWRHVHNVIVPPAALSAGDARERAGRYRLENAYLGDALVGCSTVRPPAGEDRVATVIARVLPAYRGRGLGTALYAHALGHARRAGARAVETCVLAANGDGLRFAVRHGFVETERYVLDGERDEWVDLRLSPLPGEAGKDSRNLAGT
ncbi:GNAT family N-acetyltransferase [Streptomyces sp. NPDC005435]|uniref:GNAT family N-acetyltransferase n=1 Tax=Streptomyces sp. NPDC005435 TaxID=3154464 RepID=UPI003453885D